MDTKGIRIRDDECSNDIEILAVSPIDILNFVENGDQLNWAILDLDASGDLGENMSIPGFQQLIEDSERCFRIAWEDLCSISKKFWQVIDITIIGCKEEKSLAFYRNNLEMYENCQTVIEIVDGGCCEVFSEDHALIDRLEKHFKKTERLDPDWQEKYNS